MAKNRFNGDFTNPNRARGGSKGGLAGRRYPREIAARLNADPTFVAEICRKIRRAPDDFNYAVAGDQIPSSVASVSPADNRAKPKTNLRIVWKDGRYSNFRLRKSGAAQIHLEITERFISNYEAQYRRQIPNDVREALLLFTGRHPQQKKILDSISINYVGDEVRDNERKYNNRLTLASMYGYRDGLADALMAWVRSNVGNLFYYCFANGPSRERNWMPDFFWYHEGEGVDSNVKILDVRTLHSKISAIPAKELGSIVRPNDVDQVGSTIALPFGNLQYHEHALQFRYDTTLLELLNRRNAKRNKFGARPKKSGHDNEIAIAECLNTNRGFRKHFCDRVCRDINEFVRAEAGGIHAKKEISVLGGKTTGKTDLTVTWKNGETTNISIKKNKAGQVYLVTAKAFVAVYEAQYHVLVPSKVRRALAFFIGEDPESRAILDATDISVDGRDARELAHKSNCRLMFNVIRNYDSRMADELLWFLKSRIDTIFELSFAAGAVKDRRLWSEVLWYKNLVDADGAGLDYLVPIPEIKAALQRRGSANEVVVGPKNAGSTIHLPFGHLEYHLRQLEFYQKLSKIQELILS